MPIFFIFKLLAITTEYTHGAIAVDFFLSHYDNDASLVDI